MMVEHVAERLGVSSVDLRRKWMLRLGGHYGDGQKLTESVSTELVLDTALRAVPPNRPTANRPSATVAALPRFPRFGFTGSGEKKLQGTIAMEHGGRDVPHPHRLDGNRPGHENDFSASSPPTHLAWGLERVSLAPQDTRSFPIPDRRLRPAPR